MEEKISHMAGATNRKPKRSRHSNVAASGREPRQRDSHYNHISQRAGFESAQDMPEANWLA